MNRNLHCDYSKFSVISTFECEKYDNMEKLEISSTEDTPDVCLDKTTSIFRLAERSYPEDAFEFYQPILRWIEGYVAQPNDSTLFEFKLDYFNTTSSKQIFKILMLLEELSKSKNVNVKWFYKQSDREMQSHGEIFSKVISIPFELIAMQ